MADKATRQANASEARNETLKLKYPDGGWGWIIVIASFFSQFLVDGIMYTIDVVRNPIETEIKEVDSKSFGAATAMNQLFYFILGPVIAILINQIGYRMTAFLGGFLMSFSWWAVGFCTTSPTSLMLTFTSVGASSGFVYIPAFTIVGFYFEKYRALASGIAACGTPIGVLVFSPLCEAMIKTYGWRISCYICSACISTTALLGLLYLPIVMIDGKPIEEDTSLKTKCIEFWLCKTCNVSKQIHPEHQANETNGPQTRSGSSFKRTLQSLCDVRLLKSPTVLIFLLCGSFLLCGYMIPMMNIVSRGRAYKIEKPSALLAVVGGANAIGRIVCGLLKLIPKMNLIAYCSSLLLVGGTLSVISASFTAIWFHWLYCVIFGFCAASFSMLAVIVVELFGIQHLNNIFGLQMLFMGFGASFGPWLSGILVQRSIPDAIDAPTPPEAYMGPFLLGGSAFIACGLLMMTLKCTRRWELKRGILA